MSDSAKTADLSEGAGPGYGRRMARAGTLAGSAVLTAWVLSAVYHLGLFGLMYLIPWLSGIVHHEMDPNPPMAELVGEIDQPTVTLEADRPVETQTASLMPDPTQFKPSAFREVSDVVPKRPKGLEILGIGTGGGEFDKYGFSISPGNQSPSFFGLGGEARGARHIVYVVDRSGSMLTTINGVKKELRESIMKLRRSQKFHVIFFNAGPPLENPPRRLVSAIKAHKQNAFRFVERIVPKGGTDPRPAMRRAFAVHPDLIYFLTDGEFDPALVEMLRKLNRDKQVRIFTIAYVSRTGAPLLEQIAREHNGRYRFVSEDEIYQ